MSYNRYYPGGWQDSPSQTTPIDSSALQHLEDGLVAVAGQADTLASTVADISTGGYDGGVDYSGSNPFGGGVREWVRKTLAKIAGSTAVLGAGELLVDERGNVYGGNGATQINALSPALTQTVAAAKYGSLIATSEAWTRRRLTAAFPAPYGVPAPLTSTYPNNPITTGVDYAYNSPNVTLLGCVPTTYTQYGNNSIKNSNNANSVDGPYAVEFVATNLSDVSFQLWPSASSAAPLQLFINDYPVTLDGYLPSFAGGQWNYVRYTLPSTLAACKVRLEGLSQHRFGGVRVNTGATVAATSHAEPKLHFLMDSWGATTTDVAFPYLISTQIGRLLGCQTSIGAQPGTGYTVSGPPAQNGAVFGDATRVANAASFAPDALIIAGSENDDLSSASAIQNAAGACYSALASSLPTTKLIVIGPQSTGAITAARTANRDAVKAAAAAASNVIGFVDPYGEGWISGTGKIDAPLGDGTADYLVDTTGGHMTRHGADYYAQRLAWRCSVLLRKANIAAA